MKKIENNLSINEHHKIEVIKITNHGSYEPVGTDYIIGKNLLVNIGNTQFAFENYSCIATSKKYTSFQFSGYIIRNFGNILNQTYSVEIDPYASGCLSYIDGCSNTNLIGPLRNGDPCVNYLYFPENIDQSWHTHPSTRLTYITAGTGLAKFVIDGEEKTIGLNEGDFYYLPRFMKHKFVTTDSFMSLIAFHPDSEDGPRDEFNTMKSRTYL